VTKLFGYDYEMIYIKGKDNVVTDALSRKYEDEGSLFYLSFFVPDWLQVVHQEWLHDPKNSHLIQQLHAISPVSPGYSWHNDELRYKGHLYLSKNQILNPWYFLSFMLHPPLGTKGLPKPLTESNVIFLWDGMKHGIHNFVVECDVCQ
jgi:hypothetical protein